MAAIKFNHHLGYLFNMRNRTNTIKSLQFGQDKFLQIQKVIMKHGSVYKVRKHYRKFNKSAHSIGMGRTPNKLGVSGYYLDSITIETLGVFKTLQDAEHFFLHCTLVGVMENGSGI